jgi:hypothetical protein
LVLIVRLALNGDIKFIDMHKHPIIRSSQQPCACSFSSFVLLEPLPVSRFAFARHLRRSALVRRPSLGVRVFALPCGCFVWCLPCGARLLSALPF